LTFGTRQIDYAGPLQALAPGMSMVKFHKSIGY
jgi:hypothetical protein